MDTRVFEASQDVFLNMIQGDGLIAHHKGSCCPYLPTIDFSDALYGHVFSNHLNGESIVYIDPEGFSSIG